MPCAKRQRYSVIEHIAQSILLGRYSSNSLVAMLYSSYFDASGQMEGFSLLTVAGSVASVDKWKIFEYQWQEILKEYGVKEFHATDFAASRGEYKEWKGQKEKRTKFLHRLIKVIKDNTNRFFMNTVELDGWKRANEEFMLEERMYHPYALAGFTVILHGLKWAKNRKVKELEFIFEDGDAGWEGLKKLAAQENVIPIRLPKEKAMPCQAADMLAWKTRITAHNALELLEKEGNDEENAKAIAKELASLENLLVRPNFLGIYSYEKLVKSCIDSKIPRRPARREQSSRLG